MFNLAKKSVSENPGLKFVILKRLARYDPSSVDPYLVKRELSNFGNAAYHKLWVSSGCPTNIQIYDLDLGCHGALREKRYGTPGYYGHDAKMYDGIHLRDPLAVRHFTN